MITLTTYKWVPDFAVPLMRAFRVRWALEEAGIPYKVRHISLGPEQKQPEQEPPSRTRLTSLHAAT